MPDFVQDTEIKNYLNLFVLVKQSIPKCVIWKNFLSLVSEKLISSGRQHSGY